MSRRKQQQPQKPCKKCDGRMAVIGEKYCQNCRSVILKELESSGYLTDVRPKLPPGDRLGRPARHLGILGGTAEMLDDGDDL
jgi:hypothetical protein